MKPLSPFLVLIFLTACHPAPSRISLDENNLYSIDTVRMAGQTGNERQARRLLQEAMSRYGKPADTAQTIALFKRSILANPTAKAYFELSGALLATRQYPEAIHALSVAEALGYTPLSNVMFRYAYAYAHCTNGKFHDENASQALHYMELAIQMGYPRPAQFLQKDAFPGMADNYLFEKTYAAALAGGPGVDPEKSLWDTYASRFPDVDLPLVIDAKWIREHPLTAEISYQYEKFIPEIREAKFSRGGGDSYFYIARLHKDAAYIALLYGVQDQSGDGMPASFMLVTYDGQGRIIDRMTVAGRKTLIENDKSFLMRPDLSFQLQESKTVYKQDPEQAGYDSTNISSRENLPPVEYRITATGKFEPAGSPLAAR
jgi:hypothetical protein